MKFTKEEAIKALEAKIPTKDKDLDLGRTISEAVENSIELIGDNSEMELSDFVEKVFKQVKTSIGLTHSENSKVAQKLKDQISELEKKLGKQTPPPDENEEFKQLLDKFNKLEEKMNNAEKEKSINAKRTELFNKIVESGVKDKDWVNMMLAEVTITEETDVETKAKAYVELYNKDRAKIRTHITPKSTGDTDGDDEGTAYTKSVLEQAKNQMKQRAAMSGGSPVKTETV